MNVFDKSRKAVVTVKEAVMQTTKPVEPVTKKKHLINWMAIEVVDGEYSVLIQSRADDEVIVTRRIAAIDLDDATLMFEQKAEDYVYEGKELKDA